MEIRRVSDEELPVLLALLTELDDEPRISPSEGRFLFEQVQRTGSYYMAWEDGVAVGAFYLLLYVTLIHAGQPQALVDSVVVARDRRRQGIGRLLMASALDLARQGGAGKLALSSNTKRADAHRFYDALGFRRHGVSFVVDLA
ncbi:MAG: GNAT family N-acetyltransferase [Burkholderiaceae bacterium]|nr:GNAT family N-acetyltransferase [Sulfuritalea sp.]MCF8173680.1 GNAT family N-acetyltransferase [Burkholderiaceae bacterium]MCF8184293.1 GNAT family N-acetyltransferase [Polynucleobacter sp.]